MCNPGFNIFNIQSFSITWSKYCLKYFSNLLTNKNHGETLEVEKWFGVKHVFWAVDLSWTRVQTDLQNSHVSKTSDYVSLFVTSFNITCLEILKWFEWSFFVFSCLLLNDKGAVFYIFIITTTISTKRPKTDWKNNSQAKIIPNK